MFCNHCGTKMNDGAMFCPTCGATIGAAARIGVATNAGAGAGASAGIGSGAVAQTAAIATYPQMQYQAPQYQALQYQVLQYPQTAATPKSKAAAVLLALFLGAFGAHKFYLGYKKQGGIMLGLWLAGFLLIFALGIGALLIGALWLMAFIEGIIYLTKSKEDFQRIYVQGNKPWF